MTEPQNKKYSDMSQAREALKRKREEEARRREMDQLSRVQQAVREEIKNQTSFSNAKLATQPPPSSMDTDNDGLDFSEEMEDLPPTPPPKRKKKNNKKIVITDYVEEVPAQKGKPAVRECRNPQTLYNEERGYTSSNQEPGMLWKFGNGLADYGPSVIAALALYFIGVAAKTFPERRQSHPVSMVLESPQPNPGITPHYVHNPNVLSFLQE